MWNERWGTRFSRGIKLGSKGLVSLAGEDGGRGADRRSSGPRSLKARQEGLCRDRLSHCSVARAGGIWGSVEEESGDLVRNK